MNPNAPQFGTGLLPLEKDERDLQHATVFGAMAKQYIPDDDFEVATPIVIKNQGSTDFCTGFCGTSVSEDQEHVELCPLWQFAQGKKQQGGDYRTWGCDLRSLAKSIQKVGSIPKTISPFGLDRPRDFLANVENWPKELEVQAAKFRKEAYLFLDKSPYDLFDNLRGAMWQHRSQQRSFMVGAYWRREWTDARLGIIPKVYGKPVEGHCFKIFGQKNINGEIYLKAQNSYGISVGDQGIFYFPRNVINEEFGPFGQIMFVDLDPDDARFLHENEVKIHGNTFAVVFRALVAFIRSLKK